MKRWALLLLTSLVFYYAQAADTLSVSLANADSIFLSNNFALLAQRYQVRADKALIRQAKLWDNPSFSAELGMNSTRHPRLNLGANNGEVAYSVEQIIQIAGQRSKSVRLAQLNADYSEAAFGELMRTLRLQLHSCFYALFYKNNTLTVLKEQKDILQNIVKAYAHADSNGSVAHADFIRLQALQLSLENDYLSAVKEVLDEEQTLRQLLGTTQEIRPVVPAEYSFPKIDEKYTLTELIDTALALRPDIQMAELGRKSAQANYALQKALAVPDLHLGATYDKAGSVISNYWGLTLGIDLPFWNRNQGNIRSSAMLLQQSDIQWQQQQNVVQTEVMSAYEKLKSYQQSFRPKDLKGFERSYKTLIGNVAQNFTKGNISLLQFIDFFNSYSDNVGDLNGYYQSLFTAYEELEYAVGTSLSQ